MSRDALRATSLDAIFEAAIFAITRALVVSACRIDGLFDQSPRTEPFSPLAGPPGCENSDGSSDRPRLMRMPVGDPREPLAYIEILTERPATRDELQFVDSVASVLSSAIVRCRAESAIRHQAMHDPLTGLPKRALFNDRLEHALTRRERDGGYVTVMIVDLDGFKNVNDSLGHLAGDDLLIEVARRFGSLGREVDTVARLGGDEFAILVDDLEAPDQAGLVAQRVLDTLTTPLELGERDIAISASVGIGIVIADRVHAKPGRLLSHADAAMYRAKREGKGCYRVFEEAMHAASLERMDLEQALRHALANRALTVSYQPVIDTRTGQVTSFEALARWPHPTKGLIPPDTFIPIAEESGLILDLGRLVLSEACHQTKGWHAAYPHLRPGVAVNASRLQLADPAFVNDVADILRQAGIEPSSLTLEVTESVLATDSGRIIATLDELRRTGVRIAIDDFGTGYSSLAALAEFPIDILKIDKRFVDNIAQTHEGSGFVNAIMQLAQTLQLETIAEGVERPEQHQALQELGCTHLQGYLIATPMTGEQTHHYLTTVTATTPRTAQLAATSAA